jgi:hypothetical protein
MVDRELLSAYAQGDASKFLGQLAAILIFVSLIFVMMLFGIGSGRMPPRRGRLPPRIINGCSPAYRPIGS